LLRLEDSVGQDKQFAHYCRDDEHLGFSKEPQPLCEGLEDRVPVDHVLRKTDRFLDLRALRQELARFYWSSPGLVDTHARLSSQEDGV